MILQGETISIGFPDNPESDQSRDCDDLPTPDDVADVVTVQMKVELLRNRIFAWNKKIDELVFVCSKLMALLGQRDPCFLLALG